MLTSTKLGNMTNINNFISPSLIQLEDLMAKTNGSIYLSLSYITSKTGSIVNLARTGISQ